MTTSVSSAASRVRGDNAASISGKRLAGVVELGLARVAERSRLAVLHEPVDEAVIVDRGHVALGQRDRHSVIGPNRASARHDIVELRDGALQLFQTHDARLAGLAPSVTSGTPVSSGRP
jgi:hypothetical protein